MDWIHIFRTGRHTDSAGNTSDWTREQLQKIASSYDPAKHEAPIVVGHPEIDAPAYGWVEALKVEGDDLFAKPKEVDPGFEEMVKNGRFKKISMALYPEILGLRHVGFLGAVPPSVKGLKQVQFSGNKAETFEMQFAGHQCSHMNADETFINGFEGCVEHMMQCEHHPEDSARRICAYIGRQAGKIHSENPNKGGRKMTFKEFIEKMKGLFTEAEKELGTVALTEADIAAAEKRGKEAAFAEAKKKEDDVAAREKKIKDREAALAVDEAKRRKDGIAAFCEGLLKQGKLIPAMMKHGMGLVQFMEQISSIETPIEFVETTGSVVSGERKKQTPLEFLQGFLSGLPKAIDFGETAGNDRTGPGTAGSAAEKLSLLTKEKMDEKKDLTYSAAFAEVQKENPELAQEYAGSIVRPMVQKS